MWFSCDGATPGTVVLVDDCDLNDVVIAAAYDAGWVEEVFLQADRVYGPSCEYDDWDGAIRGAFGRIQRVWRSVKTEILCLATLDADMRATLSRELGVVLDEPSVLDIVRADHPDFYLALTNYLKGAA